MVINSHCLNGISNGFNTLFNKGLENVKPKYTEISMIVPSASRSETYLWLGQMPQLREWIGEREIQSFTANSYNIQNKDFELTISIPRNDIMDDTIGIYSPIIKNMGEETRLHPDKLIFDLLARGFTEKCYDNSPFFSHTHKYIGSSFTQSNFGTEKLTAQSYTKASENMMLFKGDKKRNLNIVPDLLVVAPQNAAKAREILYSDLIEGSTNINKGTCDLMVVPELANYGEQWYLLSTKRSLRPLIFQEREKPRFTPKTKDMDDNVFFHNEFLYGVNARYNAGFGLWQLAYGSTGENNG